MLPMVHVDGQGALLLCEEASFLREDGSECKHNKALMLPLINTMAVLMVPYFYMVAMTRFYSGVTIPHFPSS